MSQERSRENQRRDDEPDLRFETVAIHAGLKPDSTGAVAPPIHLSTTFSRDTEGELSGDFLYTRTGNPNRSSLEAALARLEGGTEAMAFATGLAALSALFQALDPGDHVIAPRDLYHGTADLLREQMQRWGLGVSFVDMREVSSIQSACREETRLVITESPSNPQLCTTDLAAVAEWARERGVIFVVDNTWMTPVLQRPLELGAHVVMHSCTKYFGGHSDVAGGALICLESDAFAQRLRWIQEHAGAVPAPFDCWLIRRGLMTVALRVRAQSASAEKIASFLEGHPSVVWVGYPGLESDPGHEIASRQCHGYGAMLSFRVKGGFDAAKRVAARVELFARATSLGGVESLIEHRALVEGPHSETPRDLLRVSVGLEHVEDLIADLEQALVG